MSNAVLLDLTASTRKFNRHEVFSNLVQTTASLKELRLAQSSNSRYEWELEISLLGPSNLASYLALSAFCSARFGEFDSFLYTDPTDNQVTAQPIATTDGTATTFQLLGTNGHAIYNPNGTVSLFLNGTPVSGALFSVGANTGLITFTSAPTAGQALTATYSYYFRARLKAIPRFSTAVLNQWESDNVSFKECEQ